MRRAVAILKYVPAVLCGLLVVAWVVSWFFLLDIFFPQAENWYCESLISEGALQLNFSKRPTINGSGLIPPTESRCELLPFSFKPKLGTFGFSFERTLSWDQDGNEILKVTGRYISLPLPLLITVLLPLACGSFIHFRFPLWSYFAWTALLAAELAYYLR